MSEKLIQHPTVAFGAVDRDNVLTLPGVFQLLQEAAIAHADRYDTGTEAMLTRGESWVLNRMAVALHRYPRYAEALRVETWSSGIRSFKGFRDFRVYDSADALLVAGSSLWIYVNVRTKSILRVPREVADHFPSLPAEVFCPDLETLPLESATSGPGRVERVTLRYSDIDANDHVNNTAYLDLLQTALARAGQPRRPGAVRLKYGKAIPSDTAAVDVWLDVTDGTGAFRVECAGVVFAHGTVAATA